MLTFPENSDPYDECKGNYYLMQRNSCYFKGYKSGFYIKLTFSDYFRTYRNDKIIEISLVSPIDTIHSFYGSFTFDVDTILSISSDVSFHDTIMLNDIPYEKIYELRGEEMFYPYNSGISKVFYSIDIGIIGWATNFGKTWNLISE